MHTPITRSRLEPVRAETGSTNVHNGVRDGSQDLSFNATCTMRLLSATASLGTSEVVTLVP